MAWKQKTYRTHSNRKSFLDSISRRMLFIWCMLAGLILLLAPKSFTNKFQFAFASAFRWPIKIGRDFSLSTSQNQPYIKNLNRNDIQDRNQVIYLKEELKQAYDKIDKLSGMRNRSPMAGAKLVIADIIAPYNDGSRAELIINRGTDDGLKKNQLVMSDYCIIGKIIELDSRRARIMLLTDAKSKIDVTLGEPEIRRTMQGIGNNCAKIIPQISATNKISVRDEVLVQKTPGLLDCPMIAGIVTECKRNEKVPSVWDITVQPACDITQIDDVTVIIMNP
ncbi:MAG: hypothetical protein JW715_12585 [Sedimentisphaerales bacterium]|nr:hypothetical protein [Sedimentisphaerales bacterium]